LFDKVLSALVSKQNEVTALMAQLDEMKALQVDALGDGFYDGYLQCQKDVRDEGFDIDAVKDCDVLQWSEHYESEHRYSKSLADIRAKAVMHFAEMCRGAYLDGFVSAELTIYDLYQSARNHVKDNYAHESTQWDDVAALTARNSLTELTAKAIENIDVVNFVSMALRHTTIKGDFNFQDVKDAFNYLATEQRQSTKEGAA
jgi:hypothetical protein